jgi:hypothetical protein
MPTVAEILKSTGYTDDQIAAFDTKAVEAFTTILTTADKSKEAAELAQRANQQLYDTQIAPALNDWGTKEAALTAERDYYKTLAEKGKESGFVPPAPPFARDEHGKFVPGATGSPTLDVSKVRQEIGEAFTDGMWAMQTHQRITGQFLPDDVTALAREATALRLPFRDHVAKKYGYAEKEAAKTAAAAKEHEDSIRKDEAAKRDQYWAERSSGHAGVNAGRTSDFANIQKGIKSGERKDPLTMNDMERRQATRAAIQQDMLTNTVQ